MNYKNVFWGVILIIIGSLFILKNLDIIYFNWGSLLRLWPVLLILWGISIIPVKNGIKVLLSLVVVAISIILIVNSHHYSNGWSIRFGDLDYEYRHEEDHNRSRDWESQSIFEEFDENIDFAYLSFDAAIGNFSLNQGTNRLIEFEKEGNLGPYYIDSKENDNKVFIRLGLENDNFRGKNFENNAIIRLNPEPIWELDIDVGAADIEMDLSDFMVRKLEIDGGASSIDVRIGNLYQETELNIDAGASSINLWLPIELGCKIDATTVLTSRNYEGFEKTESGIYQTNNFEEADNKIYITLDAAIASLNFRRY